MEEATRTPEAIGQLLQAVRAVGQGKRAILDSDIELSELRTSKTRRSAGGGGRATCCKSRGLREGGKDGVGCAVMNCTARSVLVFSPPPLKFT